MATIAQCPVCESALAPPLAPDLSSRLYVVDCVRCGGFSIRRDVVEDRGVRPDQVARLSGIIRRQSDLHERLQEPLTAESIPELIAASAAPINVNGQVDALVDAIARLAPNFGDKTPRQSSAPWVARAFLHSKESFQSLAAALESRELIQVKRFMDPDSIELSLTLDGWEHLRALTSSRQFSEVVFVAMWFDPHLKPIFEEGIIPGKRSPGVRWACPSGVTGVPSPA